MTVDEDTVPGLLRARAQASPDAIAFAYDIGGIWQQIRWREFLRQIEELASALIAGGLEPGNHVGILAPTGLEWELVHHAVLCAGGVVVGLEPHDTSERLQVIAEHADLSMLVAGDAELLANLSPAFLAGLKLVVVLGPDLPQTASPTARTLESLLQAAGSTTRDMPTVAPAAAATLIYTSGTTGHPKGILYRHEQIALAVRAIIEAYPSLPIGARLVCWLPLSNLFQRIMNLAAVASGGTVFLVRNPLAVLKTLPQAQPDVFIGVPRFYEKLHAGMMQEMRDKPAVVRSVVSSALNIAERFARARREGKQVSIALRLAHGAADRLVLRRFRRVMGGRVRFMVTGSAPIAVRLLEFFDAIGLPLYEAYGLSENVVPMALGRPGEHRFGTVGRPLPPNDLRFAEDGELLVRGPGVFSGYFRDVERSDPFTADGFYRTGDYAALDPDGMLRLLGRKSEVIKTSSGRRLSPLPIEALLEELPFVDRAVVMGAGRKCLVAAISVDQTAVPPEWIRLFAAERNDVPREAAAVVTRELQARTQSLPEYQRPAGYLLLRQPLTIESGELTPNLKLRRKAIEERYRRDIASLYDAIEKEQEEIPTRLSSVWQSRMPD